MGNEEIESNGESKGRGDGDVKGKSEGTGYSKIKEDGEWDLERNGKVIV